MADKITKITVDHDVCIGCGACVEEARVDAETSYFVMEDGLSIVNNDIEITTMDDALIEGAAQACPVEAIKFE